MKPPQAIKPRDEYMKRIKPFVRHPLAKVLLGQRRVGKSYLLFQIMAEIRAEDPKANIIYVNKEDFAFEAVRTGEDLFKHVQGLVTGSGWQYVFIDEVQEIAGFEKAIRSLLLLPDMDVYLTGSNANLLSGELATLLGGRAIEIEVFSLSYLEFLTFHGLASGPDAIELYLKFGGLPYLHHLPLGEPQVIWEYLRNIYHSIVFRDIVARHQLRNTHLLEQLIHYLADTTGSLFSAKGISDYLKSQRINITSGQVQTYIDCLQESFLVHQVPRYDVRGKRLFDYGAKYYFENTGLRNLITGYRPGDKGQLLETVVCNMLKQKGYRVQVGAINGREIDFVATRDQEHLYVQVALSLSDDKVIEREFGNLMLVQDNYPKWVVSMDHAHSHTYHGIRHFTLEEFLTGDHFQ